MIDCGAYDGDTLARYVAAFGAFAAWVAFEPDPRNFAALQRRVSRLPADLGPRVRVVAAATGDCAGSASFAAAGSPASSLVTAGDDAAIMVPVVALDDLDLPSAVSIVKLDVEGAERATLLGARRLLRRDRPLLAVSCYHRQEDLWELPLLVHGLLPRRASPSARMRPRRSTSCSTRCRRARSTPLHGCWRETQRGPRSAARVWRMSLDRIAPGPLGRYREQLQYLVVGAWNTAVRLRGLGGAAVHRCIDYLNYLVIIVLSYPFAIANAYVCYRYIVFRSHGSVMAGGAAFRDRVPADDGGEPRGCCRSCSALLPFNVYVMQALFTVAVVVVSYLGPPVLQLPRRAGEGTRAAEY